MTEQLGGFLRKCRGALGISVTWAVAWAAILTGMFAIVGLLFPDSADPGESPLRAAWIGAVFGAVSGAAFAVLLSLVDGRRTIRDLSIIRAALWGGLGTAAFPLLTPVNDRLLFILCPIGAAVAAASVAVAKKGELLTESPQSRLSQNDGLERSPRELRDPTSPQNSPHP
jgi:hypothetical protein